MKLKATISIMLAVGYIFLAACARQQPGNANVVSNTAPPKGDSVAVQQPTPDEADRISLADAKKAFDAGTAVFVDVRNAEAYAMEHVRGALSIPLSDLDANLDRIPKGKKIIVYCS